MIPFEQFSDNLKRVQDRINTASQGRAISLLPVTKSHDAWVVQYAKKAGLATVGESKVQEALDKIEVVSGMKWELIGHLQTNKAKLAAQYFTRIQTVDSQKLLKKLNSADIKLRVLLQVNASSDPAKHGISIQEAPSLLEYAMNECPNITIEGLMTIPALDSDLAVARKAFNNLRDLRDNLESSFSIKLPELSMGMSSDLEVAIEEGATIVRIGSDLFGAR